MASPEPSWLLYFSILFDSKSRDLGYNEAGQGPALARLALRADRER